MSDCKTCLDEKVLSYYGECAMCADCSDGLKIYDYIKSLKAENKKFKEALERLSKTGDGTHQDKKASFYDCLLTLQLEFDERIEYAREALKELEGEK